MVNDHLKKSDGILTKHQVLSAQYYFIFASILPCRSLSTVIVACSHETCVFSCEDDTELNVDEDQVYCFVPRPIGDIVPVGLKAGWQPAINSVIRCVEDDNKPDEDNDDENDDNEPCADIGTVLSIEDEVIVDCGRDHCLFECRDVTKQVNLDLGTS